LLKKLNCKNKKGNIIMNSDVMPSIVQMGAEELQELMTEVKETVASGIQMPEANKQKPFGAVDMWNIQRKARSASDMLRRR
jgi:hypothetical protein